MSIQKRFKADELQGRRVRADKDIRAAGGKCIAAGAVLTITSAHYNLQLRTDTCPHCGQSFVVYGVKRADVTLLEEDDGDNFRPQDLVPVARDTLVDLRRRLHSRLMADSIVGDQKSQEKLAKIGWEIYDVINTALSR